MPTAAPTPEPSPAEEALRAEVDRILAAAYAAALDDTQQQRHHPEPARRNVPAAAAAVIGVAVAVALGYAAVWLYLTSAGR